jgi:hypothetical protein
VRRPRGTAAAVIALVLVAAGCGGDEQPETRTVVVKVGHEVRSEVERSLQISAAELGVECKLVEHPHLLRTQVAVTATGPHRKVEQFFSGLRAEERATIRTERAVMASPL